ncbi:MAG: class I SAM-dependent methyltransferase [Thermoplasmata archaeon]|nr:class I SAM-dependent methyltransferase [Thermoplasmata archaeon]NIS10421.1 class I SAM-dependent methyltransferase [Thermoplasmata archaeon]
MAEEEMSAVKKPVGLRGRLTARFMGFAHGKLYKAVAEQLALTEEDEFIEIGYGSGMFIKKHASHVRMAAGVDISEDMVNMANRFNRQMVEQGRADLRLGDVRDLEWPDGSFSAAGTVESFFFWPEPVACLKEVHRVLKPGGRLVIGITANKDDKRDFSKVAKQKGFALYGCDDIVGMTKEAGFRECIITRRKMGGGVVNAIIAKALK